MNAHCALWRTIRHAAFFFAIALGAIVTTGQAYAAAIIIDNYSGTRVGTRGFAGSQGGGVGTAPTFTELNGGGAIRMQPQNSIVSATLTYTPAATLDLTGGGTNDQFLVEFISVIADNGLPLQGLANLTITVNTTTGARQKAGLGITNGQGNMAFPFTTFTGSGNFSQVTSIVLAFFSQTNVSSGWGTITLDRVWASPPAGAVPTPPGAGFTAVTTTPTGNATINYTLAFSNNQGAAPITGLTSSDITLSAGTSGANSVVVTGSGSSYNAAVSGMTADGAISLTLGANTITDLWLQANPAGATSSTINYVKPPVFTNGPPPNSATVGTAYNFSYTANGTGPITYALSSGALPTGLSLSTAGAITGTPTTSGAFTGVTRATNVGSTTQNFSINVVCPALTVNPLTIASGAISTPYSQTLSTTGATGTFTYLVTAGALPSGVTLSSAGVISGTPTVSGNFNFTVTATGPSGGNCTGSRAYGLSIAGTFTVTPSAGIGGSITPSVPVQVTAGMTTIFTVTPQAGYAASVGGTCGGTLNTGTYTTNAINAPCTVAATFVLLPQLVSVESRKVHGGEGPFNLTITTGILVTGNVDVEPRMNAGGHLIVFKFNQALTAAGSVAAFNQSGAPIGTASVTRNGSDALVNLNGIPDNQRVRVVLTGVATANGAVNAEVSLSFTVGDFNKTHAVNASDISAAKARNTPAVNATNFKYDVTLDGAISPADVSAVKARSGVSN